MAASPLAPLEAALDADFVIPLRVEAAFRGELADGAVDIHQASFFKTALSRRVRKDFHNAGGWSPQEQQAMYVELCRGKARENIERFYAANPEAEGVAQEGTELARLRCLPASTLKDEAVRLQMTTTHLGKAVAGSELLGKALEEQLSPRQTAHRQAKEGEEQDQRLAWARETVRLAKYDKISGHECKARGRQNTVKKVMTNLRRSGNKSEQQVLDILAAVPAELYQTEEQQMRGLCRRVLVDRHKQTTGETTNDGKGSWEPDAQEVSQLQARFHEATCTEEEMKELLAASDLEEVCTPDIWSVTVHVISGPLSH